MEQSPPVGKPDEPPAALNPLLALTATLLHHLRGARRTELIAYLKHWNEHATLLRYLDTWLTMQPALATLRQARAETLIALGQPAAALSEIDALDREREVTQDRLRLRLAALIAAQEWATAEALIDPANGWERGDLLIAQGRYKEARRAYADTALLREASPTVREVRAALLDGEPQQARALLADRWSVRAGMRPALDELRLQVEITAAFGDTAEQAKVVATLADLEASERAQLIEMLGLAEHLDLEVVPDVPAMEVADIDVPAEARRLLQEQWGYRGWQVADLPVACAAASRCDRNYLAVDRADERSARRSPGRGARSGDRHQQHAEFSRGRSTAAGGPRGTLQARLRRAGTITAASVRPGAARGRHRALRRRRGALCVALGPDVSPGLPLHPACRRGAGPSTCVGVDRNRYARYTRRNHGATG